MGAEHAVIKRRRHQDRKLSAKIAEIAVLIAGGTHAGSIAESVIRDWCVTGAGWGVRHAFRRAERQATQASRRKGLSYPPRTEIKFDEKAVAVLSD